MVIKMSDIVKLTQSDGVCLLCGAESNVSTVAINKCCRNLDTMNVITFDICDTCRLALSKGLLPDNNCALHIDLATMES